MDMTQYRPSGISRLTDLNCIPIQPAWAWGVPGEIETNSFENVLNFDLILMWG
jgi:hypothetical protein